MKSLQKEQNSTNLLLWPTICRNNSAITPKWFNSLDTNSRVEIKSLQSFYFDELRLMKNNEHLSFIDVLFFAWFTLLFFLFEKESLLPCPFTGSRIFCVGPNFLSQPKNLTALSASSKTFVPAQKTNLLNANHIFVWLKMFVTATICK